MNTREFSPCGANVVNDKVWLTIANKDEAITQRLNQLFLAGILERHKAAEDSLSGLHQGV